MPSTWRLPKPFLLLIAASFPAFTILHILQLSNQGTPTFVIVNGKQEHSSMWRLWSSQRFKKLDPPAIERQNSRKALVDKYCSYMRAKGKLSTNFSDGEAVRVIPSLKMVYCLTPKCASRQIRGLLYHSNWSLAPALNSFSLEQQTAILDSHFKFTFVREPFERLLSAYKDKFLYPRPGDWHILSYHGKAIMENFRPNATNRSLEKLDDITFPEFIQYLVTNGSSSTTKIMDWHWDNYNNLCHMCSIDYDFIGHYETLGEDFSAFEKLVGFSFTKASGLVNGLEVNFSNTSSELLSYYSQIPLQWIKHLGTIYKSSFEMFDYSFPGPLGGML